MNEYRTPSGKLHAQRALDRGKEQGLEATAVYLPGQEVRCPALRTNQSGSTEICGGYLYTEGPESTAYVRRYEDRRFHARRLTPRGNHRCPRCECRLDIESRMTESSAA